MATMTPLGCAPTASRRAPAAARAPSTGSRPGSGGAPWPGRPRVRERGVGHRGTWCRDVRGTPGATGERACGAAAAQATAGRPRGGPAPTAVALGGPSGGSTGGWAGGGRAAASSRSQRCAPAPEVEVHPCAREPALTGPLGCGAAGARAAGASRKVAGTRVSPGLRVAASFGRGAALARAPAATRAVMPAGGPRRPGLAHDWPAVAHRTAMAAARSPHHRTASVGLTADVEPHGVPVRPLSAAVTTRAVQARLGRGLVTVRAAINVAARALKRGEGWGKTEASRGGRCHQTGECRDAMGLELMGAQVTRARSCSWSKPITFVRPFVTIGRLMRFGSLTINMIAWSFVGGFAFIFRSRYDAVRVLRKLAMSGIADQRLQLRRAQRSLAKVTILQLRTQAQQETSCLATGRSGGLVIEDDRLLGHCHLPFVSKFPRAHGRRCSATHLHCGDLTTRTGTGAFRSTPRYPFPPASQDSSPRGRVTRHHDQYRTDTGRRPLTISPPLRPAPPHAAHPTDMLIPSKPWLAPKRYQGAPA